jgi:hypothetical protein
LIYTTSESKPFEWTQKNLYDYAKEAAKRFGVGDPREVGFDAKAAKDGVEAAKRAAKDKASKKNK